MENDLFQLWRLVAELSDQLTQNRAITASLQAQAGSVKLAASHQGTGFALRRFNMHMTQEAFESELERMNATFIQQNVELQNDNKQLAALLKEYEQTLENVMSKFRTHAHSSQQQELALTRHYESLLLSRETSILSSDLIASTAHFQSVAHMSHLLRAALRECGGELPEDEIPNEARDAEREQGGYVEGSGLDDWALERDSELVRLECENFQLRRMLDIHPFLSPESSPPDSIPRFGGTSEGDHQQQGSVGMFIGPLNQESGHPDDLTLRRQASHTQGQTQISLDGAPQSHSQAHPLHIAFPPEAPLVTRRYGRRAGSGSGSFIGGGGFTGISGGGEPSTNLATGPFGPFRPSLASGQSPWKDGVPGERNMNIPPPGQDPAMSAPGREAGDTRDGQQGTGWDGLTAMYQREAGRRAPP
ncbi:hypothetical protein JB92DRAFT_3128160 [Gautieria morchelliformis]|nr:hypothetical protein JB92DRAFT_3128160 [Gautieria morchelliformis]